MSIPALFAQKNVAFTFLAHISKFHKESGCSDLKEEVMLGEDNEGDTCAKLDICNVTGTRDDDDNDIDVDSNKEEETVIDDLDDKVLNAVALFSYRCR